MRRKRFCILPLLLVVGIFAERSRVVAQDPSKGITPFGGKIPLAAIAGFYESSERQVGGVHHNYLRLLADGTVMDLNTADSREHAAKRLFKGATEKAIASGTFKLEAGRIEFTTTNQEASIHYQGEVSGNSLILDWKSTYQDHSTKKEVYKLIPGL